jgi:hypothetical protein
MRPPPYRFARHARDGRQALTIVLEPLGDGKIRVRTSSWDQEHVILADQVLEAVALGKSLRLVRAARSLESTSRPDWPTPTAARRVDFKPLLHCNTYGVTRCVTM